MIQINEQGFDKENKEDKKIFIQKLMIIIACLLVVLTVGYQRLAAQENILHVLQQGKEGIAAFEKLDGKYPSYQIFDKNSGSLGYAVIAHASGYGGEISVLTILNEQGVIKNIEVLENVETPLYFAKAINNGFLEELKGKKLTELAAQQEEIDGISGATMTSEAILSSVIKGGAQVGTAQLGLPVQYAEKFEIKWQDGVVVLLLIVALLASTFRWNKLRPWIMIVSIIVFGFWLNLSLSLANFTGLLAGNFPSILERPIWYLLVPGVLVTTLILGRNFYCTWLCPFGAVQEGTYKALNLVSYTPNSSLIRRFASWRWTFVWIAVIAALLFNNASMAGYEPFSVFFDASGNIGQWVIMVLVLLLSISVMRIWCRCFCPVGTILDFLARLKRHWNHRRTTKAGAKFEATGLNEVAKITEEARAVEVNQIAEKKQQNHEKCVGNCTNCHGDQVKLTSGDILLGACLFIIYLSVIVALALNIRLFIQ